MMSNSNHNQQTPVSYPPPLPAGYPTAAPPANYGDDMRKDGQHQYPPVETRSRGDGFWKGCCAALCCCWVLDCCF